MSAARRRVAITGIGLVTPVGLDVASTWDAVIAGRGGIRPIESFDAGGFPVRIAGEVRGLAEDRLPLPRRVAKLAGRYHRFALAAAAEALADAAIVPSTSDPERWGCVVGSGMLGVAYDDLADFQRRHAPAGELVTGGLLSEGAASADPVAFCRSHALGGLALLLRAFGIRGPSSSVHTACASGGQALGTALRLVRSGRADRALAGGFDSMVTPVGLAGFCLLGALSTDNDEPDRASRPFDRTRNGFVLGEGAGFLVLEEWERACARGARIHAELAGDGSSLSSYRITDSHPSGDGPIQAMRAALRDAGVAAAEVGYVNAHGTSTPMNDRSECAAIRAVFGPPPDGPWVSSTKALLGHAIAAAGAIEAAITALALHHGVLPANANLSERDPDCDVRLVLGESRREPVRVALSNSFGFGGSNSSLVLRAVENAA
ncbi:MAG: 3-oxoacyl-[acyl-carrier-protein] synthase [Candidatus Binatota bacterium]|nr:3-oxoacyl-[acyl-carrier-protein] synthase [Candidatus Binatota bacterium]